MDKDVHVKTIRVTNPKNTVLQLPGIIAEQWGLEKNDAIEMLYCSEKNAVILKPRKGFLDAKPIY